MYNGIDLDLSNIVEIFKKKLKNYLYYKYQIIELYILIYKVDFDKKKISKM